MQLKNQKKITTTSKMLEKDIQSTKNEEKKDLKFWLSNAKWAFSQMFRLSKRDSILLILLSILKAGVPTLSAYVFSRIFNEIVIYLGDIATKKPLVISDRVIELLVILAVLQFIGAFIQRSFRQVDVNFKVLHLKRFDNLLYEKIASLDYQYFEDPEISNLIQKAKDNSWKIREFMGVFMDFLSNFIMVLIAGIISFTISPIVTLILVVLSIPSNLTYRTFIKKWWDVYHSNIEHNRFIWWNRGSLSQTDDVAEHRLTSSSMKLIKDNRERSELIFNKELKVHREKYYKDILSSVISAFTTFGVYFYLILETLAGRISTIGDFTFYQSRMSDFSGQIGGLAGLVTDLIDSGNGLNQVKQLFEMKEALTWGKVKLPQNVSPKIEFKDVWFKYPKSKNWIFKNLNLVINAGEEIAIVGENGAGKTTLIRLLVRFYDPVKGQVLINGKDVRTYSKESYYSALSALFQEFNSYGEYDVKNNIAIGRSDKKIDMEAVKKAAKYAEADEFIEKLDNKYDQMLNKQFTGGTNISGGQWQKIAIAKMFYRNSPILILDEPTASIDAVSEYNIFRRIYKFMSGKTVIIISHRFSTVRNAQRIYVLSGGKIIEEGKHSELMKLKGEYANAFNLQAGGYAEEK